MKRLVLTSAVVLSLGLLAACETATPYQPLHADSQSSGGYSDIKLETDRWRVTFRGNSLTSRETVETYLLYRAAQLTIDQGYDWFEPQQRHTDKSVQVDPGFYGGYGGYGWGWAPYWRYYGYGYGWRGWDPYWGDPFFDTTITEKYEASAEIVMGHGPKPPNDRRAMDAREVMTNLSPHIVLPKAG
ncbi:MAG TPA: hypothetical protein VHY57_06055 [Rhizomicrobium sp.]|jgi:hypothetical protein|nr:hypothetical protein [Rhizomicrobium sp.]